MTVAARPYSILGLGAPCLDYIIHVSEEFLNELPGSKEGMQPIDQATLSTLIAASHSEPQVFVGGSACNTIKGLARLGFPCAFTGKIGKDPLAAKVREKMQREKITLLLHESTTPTAQILSLVAPNGSRTFRAFRGASHELRPEELVPSHFEGVKLLHIEGYTLANKGLTERAMQLAQAAGALISFDLASYEIVRQHRELIVELLTNYIDIVFSNTHEICALTDLSSPEKGCEFLRSFGATSAILMGREGCWVGDPSRQVLCPAYPVDPIDTTGAGDLFASGFLYGYLTGAPLEKSAHYGALLGAAVVQVHGTDLSDATWLALGDSIP